MQSSELFEEVYVRIQGRQTWKFKKEEIPHGPSSRSNQTKVTKAGESTDSDFLFLQSLQSNSQITCAAFKIPAGKIMLQKLR